MLHLLIIFSLFSQINGCLVVRTPKCECISLVLDWSNIEGVVGNHAFYNNVSRYAMSAPKISIDGCSVSVYCEGEKLSLVLFDSTEAIWIGPYAADGFCDSTIQSWRVADDSGLKTYGRLYGVCVNYAAGRTTVTPPGPPTTKQSYAYCACKMDIVDIRNAQSLIGYHDYYLYNVSRYNMKFSWAHVNFGCPSDFTCDPGTTKVLASDATMFEAGGLGLNCDTKTGIWSYNDAAGKRDSANYLAMSCVNFSDPLPNQYPIESMCKCSHGLIRALTEEVTKIVPVISDDRCTWTITCRDSRLFVFAEDGYSERYVTNGTTIAVCDKTTSTWSVTDFPKDSSQPPKTWKGFKEYWFGCNINY